MSDEHENENEEKVTCPVCTAEYVGSVCPNCGAELPDEELEPLIEGEPSVPEGFPEGTRAADIPILTDGINISRDPTTLSQEELTITINQVRKMVQDHAGIADATIAYAIKCIAIMRQSRPTKEPCNRVKPVIRQMNLEDF